MMNRWIIAMCSVAILLSFAACESRQALDEPAQPSINSEAPEPPVDKPVSESSAPSEPATAQTALPEGWKTYIFEGFSYDLPGDWPENRLEDTVIYQTENGPAFTIIVRAKEDLADIDGESTLEEWRDALLANEILDGDSNAYQLGDYPAMRVDYIDFVAFTESADGELLPEQAVEGEGRVFLNIGVDLGDRLLYATCMYTEQWQDSYGLDMKQVIRSFRIADEAQ